MASPYTGRVIIRTDSRFLDSYNNIVTEWVKLCGAAYDSDEDKDNWHKKNLVRVAGIDERRMHIVVDMGLNDINPADSGQIPLRVYRYTRDNHGKGYGFSSLAMRIITDES